MTDIQAEAPTMAPDPRRLDIGLTVALWLLVAAVLALSAYFGYTVYQNRQRELLSSGSYRLIRALQNQARQSPNDAMIRVRLGEALASAGRYPESVVQFNAALKIEPKHPGAYLDLGTVAMATEKYSKAETYFEKVVELTKGSEFGNIDKRRETAYFYLGEVNLIQKDYEEAAGYYKQALRMRSDASDTYLKLAAALVGLGDEQGAIDNLNIAIAFDPNYPEAQYELGRLYKKQDDYVNASLHLQKAAELSPDIDIVQEAFAELGQAADWEKKAKAALVEGDAAQALDDARVAHNLEPKKLSPVVLIAEIHLERGDKKGAYEAYKQAAEIDPTDKAVEKKAAELRAQLLVNKNKKK